MKFVDCSRETIEKFFLENKKLAIRSLLDGPLERLLKEDKWMAPSRHSMFAELMDGDTQLGVLVWEEWSSLTVTIHFYLRQDRHKQGLNISIRDSLIEYFTPKDVLKIAVIAPQICGQVTNAMMETGFKLEGILPNFGIWREQVMTFNIFALNIGKNTWQAPE